MKRFILFTAFIIASTSLIAQKQNSSNIFHSEKFSIGAGLGTDYGITGIRATKYFSDRIGLSMSLTPLHYSNYYFGQVGIELKFPDLLTSEFCPFISLAYGINIWSKLQFLDFSTIPPEAIIEIKAYLNPSLTIGTRWKPNKWNRTYFNFGITYRYVGSAMCDDAEAFNREYRTTYICDYKRLVPALGIHYAWD